MIQFNFVDIFPGIQDETVGVLWRVVSLPVSRYRSEVNFEAKIKERLLSIAFVKIYVKVMLVLYFYRHNFITMCYLKYDGNYDYLIT